MPASNSNSVFSLCFLQQPILYTGATGDPQKANALKQSLDYLDMYLEESAYAAGDQLTIADFSLLASVTHLEGVDWSYKAYDNINRWVNKLKSELPYYDHCNKAGLAMFKDWVKARALAAASAAAAANNPPTRKSSKT